jgi:hypothetical protein
LKILENAPLLATITPLYLEYAQSNKPGFVAFALAY